jgi:hypothetical protein
LRHRLWEKTRGKTKKFMQKHVATYRRLHDLTNKPSSNKGGGASDGNEDASLGEVMVNPDGEDGMNY